MNLEILHDRMTAAGLPIYSVDRSGVAGWSENPTDEQRAQAQQIYEHYVEESEVQNG